MKQVSMFEIPANGKLVLEPGGNHIMLMNIPAPIKPGQDVTVTLTCESGGTAQFTAKARTYSGANETYSPGSPSSQMSMPAAPSADMSMPSTTN
jgi:copper(I)-binding protein